MRRLIAQDSHIPEIAGIYVPAQMTGTDDGWDAFRRYRAQADLAPRPLRLLMRPEPIEAVAEVPDGPPLRFRWRRALHEVIAAEGPERIEGAWWSEHGGIFRNLRAITSASRTNPVCASGCSAPGSTAILPRVRPRRRGSCTGRLVSLSYLPPWGRVVAKRAGSERGAT